MDQQRLVVQYRGHFLQLKPQNRRYGPTRSKALICEWRMEQSRCATGMNASSTKIWCCGRAWSRAPKARPHREPASVNAVKK